MHELALANQVISVVSRAAAGRRVVQVDLAVGALRQVVPETLAQAWKFSVATTPLEQAELVVEWIPLVIRCSQGHQTTVTGELDMFCPTCGELGMVVSGEEFRVTSIDVADA